MIFKAICKKKKIIFKLGVLIFLLLIFYFNSRIEFYYIERIVEVSPHGRYKVYVVDKKQKGSSLELDEYLGSIIYFEDIEKKEKIEYFEISHIGEQRYTDDGKNKYNNIKVNWNDGYVEINVEKLFPEYIYSYHYEKINEKFEVGALIKYKIEFSNE